MIVVISNDRGLLAAVLAELSANDLPPAIAVQGIGVALGIFEDNEVQAVIVDEPSGSPITRAIARRFPDLECIGVSAPVDFAALRERLTQSCCERQDDGETVVARGTEELVGLLGLTNASASVDVSARQHCGVLHIEQGHIIGAQVGKQRGRDAALRILGWRDARVRSSRLQCVEASIRVPVARALHDCARRRDELLHLGSRTDVDAIFAPLTEQDDFAAALLSDADHGVALVQRGTRRESTTRRLWQATRVCAANPDCIALWDPLGSSVVAAMLGPEHVIALAFSTQHALARHRRSLTTLASGLAAIIDQLRDDDVMPDIAALPWA